MSHSSVKLEQSQDSYIFGELRSVLGLSKGEKKNQQKIYEKNKETQNVPRNFPADLM